jgi:uncharacterized membrane protein SirB2
MKKVFFLIFLSWLLFFIATPPFHTPDETEHYENSFWLSRFIYPVQPENRNRPKLFINELMDLYIPFDIKKIARSDLKNKTYTEDQIKKFEPITLQSYHPPLYFFLISFSHQVSNFFRLDLVSRFYLARIFSAFLYFGTVVFAYKTLKILIAKEYIISSILLFFSLNPLVIKSAVGINPDTGMTLFSIVSLYLMMKWQKKKIITLKQTIVLSIIAGLATLSKFSGIFLTFIFPIYAYIKKRVSKELLFLCFTFYVVSLILLSPWFYLNMSRYGRLSPPAFSFAEYRELQPHGIIQAMTLSVFELRHTIMHFSGFLGPTNNINPPKLFFLSYTIVISILALAGFLVLFQNIRKRKKFFWVTLHFSSLLLFLFVLGTYFKKQGFSWDLQGRYFIPGFFSLTIYIFIGVMKLLRQNAQTVSQILFFTALGHFYYILFFSLIPSYYRYGVLFRDFRLLYPIFGELFVLAFLSHVILVFSITRRLFNPASK